MHTLTLHLKTSPDDEIVINNRFRALAHVHNVTVKYARKLIVRLKYDKEYQLWLREYREINAIDEKRRSKAQKARRKELSGLMNERREDIGLTKSGLEKYTRVCGEKYRGVLASQQIQKEVDRVWNGVEKVLFGSGKFLHFKKGDDFNTISQKSAGNGIKFHRDSLSIEWSGLEIPCKYPFKKEKELEYLEETLNHDVKFCEIKRRAFNNGWHYYVIIYLDGKAPEKFKSAPPDKTMGIDPGVSTVAAVSDDKVFLEELAPDAAQYEKKIEKLQQYMDRSKRVSNPERFNADGTVKKGVCGRWKYSKSYEKARMKLKTLYRKKSEYTETQHNNLANRLLENSGSFIVEDMDFAALARKSRKTERKEVSEPVKNKDGTTTFVRKYKRKKRFGHSIGSRSPALFLTTLERKCIVRNGTFKRIDTKSFKASQYDHVTDEYIKVPLSQREKIVNDNLVQRDLYSAFLIWNTSRDLKHADRTKCSGRFEKFVTVQNDGISDMKKNGMSMKQCFGF